MEPLVRLELTTYWFIPLQFSLPTIVCGLDFLFAIAIALGTPCKVSTLDFSSSGLTYIILSLPRLSGVHFIYFYIKVQDELKFPSLTSQLLYQLSYSGIYLFGDPDGNRTHVSAVKGRCLDRLTTGPENNLVSHRRLELRTTWLKVKCSTTWANGP